jgi:hypothetical protein
MVEKLWKSSLTLVFLSTHSSHDNVGLLRFCFFFGGPGVDPSSFLMGDASKEVSVPAGDSDG